MPSPSWPSCPKCGSGTVTVLHESNPEATSSHATLECEECGRVFKDVVETPQELEVRCVISDGDESNPGTLELPEDQRLRVDDEVYGEGHRLLVTSIELADGRRVRSAEPSQLGTVWCKVFDTVDVGIAVNQGHRTWTGEMTVAPEEEFLVGDELSLKWGRVLVHAIKTEHGIRHEGSAEARDIKRVYAKALEGEPIGYDEVHRSERSDVR